MKRSFRLMLGLLLVTLAFTKCTPGDFQGDLPNGYKLFKANTTQIAIIPPDRSTKFVEYITKIGTQDNLIFGEVDALPPEIQKRRIDRNEEPHPGYFIVDTKTRSVQSGLEKESWLEGLRELGTSKEPSLQMPSSLGDEPTFLTIFKIVGILLMLVFFVLRPEISNWSR